MLGVCIDILLLVYALVCTLTSRPVLSATKPEQVRCNAKRNYLWLYYWHLTAELHNIRDSWWLSPLWWGSSEEGVIMSAEPEVNHKGKPLPVSFYQRYKTRDAGEENKRQQMSLAINWKMQLCKQSSSAPLSDSWSVYLMHIWRLPSCY